jgi:hypothetical protein
MERKERGGSTLCNEKTTLTGGKIHGKNCSVLLLLNVSRYRPRELKKRISGGIKSNICL